MILAKSDTTRKNTYREGRRGKAVESGFLGSYIKEGRAVFTLGKVHYALGVVKI